MAIGYGFWETGSEFPVSIDILVRGVVLIEVSSHANCDSYFFKSALILAQCLV